MEGSVRPDRISIGPDCVDCVEGSASMNGRSEVGTRKSLSWHLYSCQRGVKKVLIKCCVIVDVSKTCPERSLTRSF